MTLFDWVHFSRPEWLLLVPILWFLSTLIHWKPASPAITKTVASHLLPYLIQQPHSGIRQKWLGVMSVSLLIVGLSGISFNQANTPLYSANQKTVFIVDQSLSLYAKDVRPNRLTRAKQLLRDILNGPIEGDLAMITFAGDAYVVSPFTQDKETLIHFLVALDPLIMPLYGSNLADGIAQGLKLVSPNEAAYTTFVILTDDLQARDAEYFKRVTQANITLEVISVGTEQGGPIVLPDGRALQHQGISVIPKTPVDTIKQLTIEARGHYYSHLSAPDDLSTIGSHASQAIEAHRSDIAGMSWQEQGHWFAIPFLIWLLGQFHRGGIFVLAIIVFNPPAPAHAAILDWFQTNDQKAQQAVDQGDWATAKKLFEHPRWKAASQYAVESYEEASQQLKAIANSASDFYNLGNALALNGQLEAAVDAYKQALEHDPTFTEANENLTYLKEQLNTQQAQPNATPNGQHNNTEPQQSDSHDSQAGNSAEDSNNTQQKQDNNREKTDNQHASSKADADTEMAAVQTETEKEQALKQWLRQIQDDPGTLLQRKLRYLHQERRNENRFTQEEGQQPW